LKYRDANVINFDDLLNLGDLRLSQADIDDNDVLVLPTSRDIRITLFPACSDKAGAPAYFGFAKTEFRNEFRPYWRAIQFFVRQKR